MENMFHGTKGDYYADQIINRILLEGKKDNNPRPKYSDGTPAHTLSVNYGQCVYDLTAGDTPLWTKRPIPTKSAIGELFWIYQDQSNDLDLLEKKYGVTWWNPWDIGNRSIGQCYGATVKRYNQMNNLLEGLINDPDGRRHMIDLWQLADFNEPHALKPCAFLTEWNVRHGDDGIDYLDMKLTQRSSDFLTAGSINQFQYVIFQYLVARHTGYVPGFFVWDYGNIQIYDRHINQAKELLNRKGIDCMPQIELNPDITNFYDFTVDDIKITGYPRKKIMEKNPQMKFDLGI